MGAMYGRFQSHRLIGAEGLHKWTLNGGESASLDNHWLQDAVFLIGTFNHKSLLPWTCDKDTSTYICNIYIYTYTHAYMHTDTRNTTFSKLEGDNSHSDLRFENWCRTSSNLS